MITKKNLKRLKIKKYLKIDDLKEESKKPIVTKI